jgi:hypothetical protein
MSLKFPLPRIVRPLRLGDFLAELGDVQVLVWVNPPADLRQQRWALLEEYNKTVNAYQELAEKKRDEKKYTAWKAEWAKRWKAWFAEIWSQGVDLESHWTLAEVEDLEAQAPALVEWLIRQTLTYVDDPKKASMTA